MTPFLIGLLVFMFLTVATLGGSIASFLGVVAERKPRGESINGRSHCACGRQLKATENIPVLGWLISGGKAKCCGARIPQVYFVTELFLAFDYALFLAPVLLSLIMPIPLWMIVVGVLGALSSTFVTYLFLKKTLGADNR